MDFATIMSAIGQPATSGAIVWYLLQSYFQKQSVVLKDISASMTDMKIKIAVHETRAALVDDLKKEINAMREELTKTKSKVDAAWKMLDSIRK